VTSTDVNSSDPGETPARLPGREWAPEADVAARAGLLHETAASAGRYMAEVKHIVVAPS
jgi:hypothetical protein